MNTNKSARKSAISEMKRNLILTAAKAVFEREGLEGGSLRAIAKEAGYTTAALYSYFDSKESIYAELLSISLLELKTTVDEAVAGESDYHAVIYKNAKTFFEFYASNPQDLELGFYLFQGGMRPKGVGGQRDNELNEALLSTLQPIIDSTVGLGKTIPQAKAIAAEVFAQISGVLLLHFTRRIRIFDVSPTALFEAHIKRILEQL